MLVILLDLVMLVCKSVFLLVVFWLVFLRSFPFVLLFEIYIFSPKLGMADYFPVDSPLYLFGSRLQSTNYSILVAAS